MRSNIGQIGEKSRSKNALVFTAPHASASRTHLCRSLPYYASLQLFSTTSSLPNDLSHQPIRPLLHRPPNGVSLLPQDLSPQLLPPLRRRLLDFLPHLITESNLIPIVAQNNRSVDGLRKLRHEQQAEDRIKNLQNGRVRDSISIEYGVTDETVSRDVWMEDWCDKATFGSDSRVVLRKIEVEHKGSILVS
jgi:hypothetical protein